MLLCFLFGPSSLTVIYSLFSLVRQWIHFTSVYSGLWEVQFLDKVCSLFVVQRQVPGCPDIPVVRRGSSPWSSSSFHGAVFGQGCCCARCWSTTGAPVPQLQFSTVVDTPFFAQWLIPMVLTIEISQLQFDKVVFVPVVQSVQFILPSTFLPWRRGWFPWSCMSKTIVIPPGAHGPDYAVYCGGSAVCVWLVFLGPCTQVHGQGSPVIRAGKG